MTRRTTRSSLIQTIQTRAVSPFIKPDESFIDFFLSECEESDVHYRLYLAINSSYETVYPRLGFAA